MASPLLRSRIRLDTNLRRWFSRNLGLWRSRRTYFFTEDDEVLRVDMLLRIEIHADAGEGDEGYRFTWWPEQDHRFFDRKPSYRAEGTMEAWLCGHQLRRSSRLSDGRSHRQPDPPDRRAQHGLSFPLRGLGDP